MFELLSYGVFLLAICSIIVLFRAVVKRSGLESQKSINSKDKLILGISAAVYVGANLYILENFSSEGALTLIIGVLLFSILLALFIQFGTFSKGFKFFVSFAMSLLFIYSSLNVYDKYESINVPNFSNNIAKIIKYVTPVGHFNSTFVDLEDEGRIKLKSDASLESMENRDVDARESMFALGLDPLSVTLMMSQDALERNQSPFIQVEHMADISEIQNSASSDVIEVYKGDTGYVYRSKIEGKWYSFLIFKETSFTSDIKSSNTFVKDVQKELKGFNIGTNNENFNDYQVLPIFEELLPIDSNAKAENYNKKLNDLIEPEEKNGGYSKKLIANSNFDENNDKSTSLEYRTLVSLLNNGNNIDEIGE